MNKQSPGIDSEKTVQSRELEQLREQTVEAEARLARLLSDAAAVAPAPTLRQLADAVASNEQLLVASINAHRAAEAAELALAEILRTSEVDVLTQLPNRLLLLDRLAHAIAHARRNGTMVAVLYLDLDDFKQINDSHGHAAGDAVLRVTAQRLSQSLRAEDMVSRHGGDEFVIVVPELSRVDDAVLVADKVSATLRRTLRVGNEVLRLKASIGISVFPVDGNDADTLVDRADAAMYTAKRMGLDNYIFQNETCSRDAQQAATAAIRNRRHRDSLSAAEHERHHAQLREANEELVLAALGAQKLQAAAELAFQRQKDVLTIVAHELRGPLTPMRMAAGMLGRARPAELLKLKGLIEREVIHMSMLVGDLLDVSRAEEGKLRVERVPVDMVDVIDQAVQACRHGMEDRHQIFSMGVPDTRLDVLADATRMVQVVRNLLDNASKYTPEGGRIRLELVSAGTDMVLIVADDGIGIRAEALPHVFDPFVQDIRAVGFNGVGVGIGLAVVRELVDAHGGSVVARSEGDEKGSTFIVTIPRIV